MEPSQLTDEDAQFNSLDVEVCTPITLEDDDTISIRQFCFETIEQLTLAVSRTLIYCGQNCTPRLLYGRFHRTADLGSCTASFRSTQKLDRKRKSDHKTA